MIELNQQPQQQLLIAIPLEGGAAEVLERAVSIRTEEGFILFRDGDQWRPKVPHVIAGQEGHVTLDYVTHGVMGPFLYIADAYRACKEYMGPIAWEIWWTDDTELTSERHGPGGDGKDCEKYEDCTKAEALARFETENAWRHKKPFILSIKPTFPEREAKDKEKKARESEEQDREKFLKLKTRFEPEVTIA